MNFALLGLAVVEGVVIGSWLQKTGKIDKLKDKVKDLKRRGEERMEDIVSNLKKEEEELL